MRSHRESWRARCVLVLVASGLALGCTHTYSSEPIQQGARLARAASVYVNVPASASFGDRQYVESGRQTAAAVADAFRRHLARVAVAPRAQEHEAALVAARADGFDYLAEAVIDHWEDRATEWSGMPDVIVVRVALYRVSDGELLDAARLSGRSRWATFGGDHPQDLLEEPIMGYVDGLF